MRGHACSTSSNQGYHHASETREYVRTSEKQEGGAIKEGYLLKAREMLDGVVCEHQRGVGGIFRQDARRVPLWQTTFA